MPLRIPPALLAEIERAAVKTSRTKQDVIRTAAEIGLAVLAEVDYDVPGIVARFALAGGDATKQTRSSSQAASDQYRKVQAKLRAAQRAKDAAAQVPPAHSPTARG